MEPVVRLARQRIIINQSKYFYIIDWSIPTGQLSDFFYPPIFLLSDLATLRLSKLSLSRIAFAIPLPNALLMECQLSDVQVVPVRIARLSQVRLRDHSSSEFWIRRFTRVWKSPNFSSSMLSIHSVRN